MPHFPKPAEGTWTEHYGIDTTPVSYQDSISPEHYELERDAIFRRTWLNLGRVEQLPARGQLLHQGDRRGRARPVIVRSGPTTRYRAFYNICRHRGNKLVWQDFPNEEVSGSCRAFTCKYHGWGYDLEGDLQFVQQEEEFFDFDKADSAVAAGAPRGVGRLRSSSTSTTMPRRSPTISGRCLRKLEGYPFHEFTQVYKYRAEVGSNWKLFIDAFTEFYHAPILHGRQAVGGGVAQARGLRLRGAVVRGRRPAQRGVVVGRHVAAEGREHGEADRAQAPRRSLRPVGLARRRAPSCRPA